MVEPRTDRGSSQKKYGVPWVRSRGLGRLLAQETNISDLIQFLSDRDPSPWAELVGFVPDSVLREALGANHADLLLTSDTQAAVVEVKLGHEMSAKQQQQYEALSAKPSLYLAALNSDRIRLAANSISWSFLSLSEVLGRWEEVEDEMARLLAGEAAGVLRGWDEMISGVFDLRSAETWTPLTVLNQKFLGRVVTRRIAQDLRDRAARQSRESLAVVVCPSSKAGPGCGTRGQIGHSSRRSDGGRPSREASSGSGSISGPAPTRRRTRTSGGQRTSWRSA